LKFNSIPPTCNHWLSLQAFKERWATEEIYFTIDVISSAPRSEQLQVQFELGKPNSNGDHNRQSKKIFDDVRTEKKTIETTIREARKADQQRQVKQKRVDEMMSTDMTAVINVA
jgi:hypothetical protein